jgi:hypothetical protein
MTTRPYRPSNGTEGLDFQEEFCDRCRRDAEYRRTEAGRDSCPIVSAALTYLPEHPSYPVEWVQDESGARCTAFEPMDEPADEPAECDICYHDCACCQEPEGV